MFSSWWRVVVVVAVAVVVVIRGRLSPSMLTPYQAFTIRDFKIIEVVFM